MAQVMRGSSYGRRPAELRLGTLDAWSKYCKNKGDLLDLAHGEGSFRIDMGGGVRWLGTRGGRRDTLFLAVADEGSFASADQSSCIFVCSSVLKHLL
jgi:hypothetical protein